MAKRKAVNSIISIEDIEDNFDNGIKDGFGDYIPSQSDNSIFEISFEDNSSDTKKIPENIPLNESNDIKLKEIPLNPSSIVTKIRGLTPPIDGEPFDIKRGYQFRASTIKKLNQLKGSSDNINIYLNEIIDAAICFYYDSVLNNK